jgi:hypothetical protein
MNRLNKLEVEEWACVMNALTECKDLKEICDFGWSATLLAPTNWATNWAKTPRDAESQKGTREFFKNGLDLHSMGLGEPKATIVLAELLPRAEVSNNLKVLNIRCHEFSD